MLEGVMVTNKTGASRKKRPKAFKTHIVVILPSREFSVLGGSQSRRAAQTLVFVMHESQRLQFAGLNTSQRPFIF